MVHHKTINQGAVDMHCGGHICNGKTYTMSETIRGTEFNEKWGKGTNCKIQGEDTNHVSKQWR